MISDLHNPYSSDIIISEEADPTSNVMYQFPGEFPRWIAPPPRRQAVAAFRPTLGDRRVPDLQSQLEALLDAVWDAEANWRFDDRLDQALKLRR